VVCLVVVFRKIEFAQLRTALAAMEWHFVAVGLAALGFDYAMRILRWAVLLRAGGAHVSGLACTAPFLGSVTLNNVLPFRAGDVVRALVFPAALGVRRVTAAASLILERLIDMLTLLLALGVGLVFNSVTALPEWLGKTAVILAVIGGAVLLSIILMHGPVVRLMSWARSRVPARLSPAIDLLIDITCDLAAMSRLRVLLILLLLSALIWGGEAGLFLSVMKGLHIDVGFPAALVVMAVATLSTLVPSSPGYVGPFHLAAYSAAIMFGAEPSQAASFALLAHLGLWLPTTVAGSIAILAKPALFKGRGVLASNTSI